MFISINKGTNIPISGKINFFMLNNKYFCNYNYYFKHFRKKSLKSKKAPFLKKKLKAVRRYIKFNPTTRRLKLRATSNHKPFIKFLVKNLKKRVVRRRSKRILSYIWRTPFVYRITYATIRREFKAAKVVQFFSSSFLLNKEFKKLISINHKSYSGEFYDQYTGTNPARSAINMNYSLLRCLQTKGLKKTRTDMARKRVFFAGSTRLKLFYKKPQQIGRGASHLFWSELPKKTVYRSRRRFSTRRKHTAHYSKKKFVKKPMWYKHALIRKKTAESLQMYELTSQLYWSKNLLNFYYYAFPSYKFVRASLLRKSLLRKKLQSTFLKNSL